MDCDCDELWSGGQAQVQDALLTQKIGRHVNGSRVRLCQRGTTAPGLREAPPSCFISPQSWHPGSVPWHCTDTPAALLENLFKLIFPWYFTSFIMIFIISFTSVFHFLLLKPHLGVSMAWTLCVCWIISDVEVWSATKVWAVCSDQSLPGAAQTAPPVKMRLRR